MLQIRGLHWSLDKENLILLVLYLSETNKGKPTVSCESPGVPEHCATSPAHDTGRLVLLHMVPTEQDKTLSLIIHSH